MNDTPRSGQIFDSLLETLAAYERKEVYFSDVANALYLAKWQTNKIERELAAERAKVEKLFVAIISVLPEPPYHPDLEPEWVYLSKLVDEVAGKRESVS